MEDESNGRELIACEAPNSVAHCLEFGAPKIRSSVEWLQEHQANHTVILCECLPTDCEDISLLKDACTSASSTNRLDY